MRKHENKRSTPPARGSIRIFKDEKNRLSVSQQIDLTGSLSSSTAAVNFGLDILVCIVKWMIDLSHTAEYVVPIMFLEMFVGFYLERGDVLPSLVHNG